MFLAGPMHCARLLHLISGPISPEFRVVTGNSKLSLQFRSYTMPSRLAKLTLPYASPERTFAADAERVLLCANLVC
jgi:hypothetical protein